MGKEVFGADSNLVFTMLNSEGRSLECYCPQPSFARTKPLLPLFRVLSERVDEVNLISYPVDFEYILEDALSVVKSRGYGDITKQYEAWCIEAFSMAQVFDIESGEVLEAPKALKDDKNEFRAWLCFFLVLARYFSKKIITHKERTEYFTQLNFEDFRELFMKSLKEHAPQNQNTPQSEC